MAKDGTRQKTGVGRTASGPPDGEVAPTVEPGRETETIGENAMSETMPTQDPPNAGADSSTSVSGGADGAPTVTPEAAGVGVGSGIAAWLNDKRVSGLWGINQNRNSWVHITGVGWKKLANNSDTAVFALTILAASAKQTQTAYNYRDEADGMIHESYVW
jgi:hypothetical protein